jgi:ubiquinone/menaquinone biosynthesis C-methylase UbiE
MREYQADFSANSQAMFDPEGRQRKAATMVRVLEEDIAAPLNTLNLLNVGGSAGLIDEFLSRHFRDVTSIDIDEKAIAYAASQFQSENLHFTIGDALNMTFPDESFDAVVCSQVYEHVPDAKQMMDEIYRVLTPGGVVYFAAGNRIMFNEPHYNLPLLSVLPRFLAHTYIKLSGKADYYYEKHYTYWGLKRLVRNFQRRDYTAAIINDPKRYHTEYMIKPNSKKHTIAKLLAKYLIFLVPGYIWLLKKPQKGRSSK